MHHLHPVHWNLTAPFLYEHAVRRGEGDIGFGGSFVANTGRHTGRSPRDKYIVNEPGTKDTVDWGDDQPADRRRPSSTACTSGCSPICKGRELFVQDLYAGADPEYRLPVRVVSPSAWHSLFARNMFIRPPLAELADFQPAFTILHAPDFRAIPEFDGIRSETFIFVNFASRLVLIGGTRYAGEIKKSVFGYLNFVLPARDVLPMHCSANVGPKGDSAIFFGLSGTGKTTLSADASRTLIGDDEHGWSPQRHLQFRGRLLRQGHQPVADRRAGDLRDDHPLRHRARKRRSRPADPDARCRRCEPDREYAGLLSARLHSECRPARAGAAPEERHHADLRRVRRHAADRQAQPGTGDVSFPVRLYGAGRRHRGRARQGAEGGVLDLLRRAVHAAAPSVYAQMLRDRIARYGADCWLVNTGWSGGAYGVGQRMAIAHTRALLRAALDGSLAEAPMRQDPNFGFLVPESVAEIPGNVLDPRRTWPDERGYDETARSLRGRFESNFKPFEPYVDSEVKRAAIRSAA